MGIFANSASPLDSHVDKATSDKNTSDDWSIILDVCDRVNEYSDGSKDFIKAINRKLTCDNPRVAIQAITLLDACVNNCGKSFLLEVASRDFEGELRKLITSQRTHPKVSQKLLQCLKNWAEGEFKGNAQLSLIPALYSKLQQDGFDFSPVSSSPKKKVEYSTDPNVVNNKQEEDDIAQAIQLSLQTSSSSSKSSSHNSGKSLYPNDLSSNLESSLVISDSKGASSASVAPAVKKARALYDFEAVEDNELTFQAGELIVVIDCSDPNWWKGSNHRGEGLFPANFVTLDVNGESEQQPARNEKRVSFSECVKVTEVDDAGAEVEGAAAAAGQLEVSAEIDEEKINLLLHLLHEADPTGERPDDPQLPHIEERVSAMAPTIDAELEQIDRRHNELARLNNDLMQGLNLYHQLMREMPVSSMGYFPPGAYAIPQPGMDQANGHMMPHLSGPHPQMPGYPPMYMMSQQPQPVMYPPMAMPHPQPTAGTMPHPQPTAGTMPHPQPTAGTIPHPTSPPTGAVYPPPPATNSSQEGGVSDAGPGGGILPSYGHYPDAAAYHPAYNMSPLHQPPQHYQHQPPQPAPAFQQPLL